jgi:hypothetical protein
MSDVHMPEYLPPDELLADRLGLTPAEFKRYRTLELVTVSIAPQRDGDAFKITCQLGNRVWEGLVENGRIAFEQVRYLRGKLSKPRAQDLD